MIRALTPFGILLALAPPMLAQAPTLTVGQPAPALAVETWLKGTPVAAFEKGQVYVEGFGYGSRA